MLDLNDLMRIIRRSDFGQDDLKIPSLATFFLDQSYSYDLLNNIKSSLKYLAPSYISLFSSLDRNCLILTPFSDELQFFVSLFGGFNYVMSNIRNGSYDDHDVSNVDVSSLNRGLHFLLDQNPLKNNFSDVEKDDPLIFVKTLTDKINATSDESILRDLHRLGSNVALDFANTASSDISGVSDLIRSLHILNLYAVKSVYSNSNGAVIFDLYTSENPFNEFRKFEDKILFSLPETRVLNYNLL